MFIWPGCDGWVQLFDECGDVRCRDCARNSRHPQDDAMQSLRFSHYSEETAATVEELTAKIEDLSNDIAVMMQI